MPDTQLACTTYTLREYTRTPDTIARTLARVKQIGYTAVQFSGLGRIEPAELGKILNGEGLTCCATHTSLAQLRDNTQKVIDDHCTNDWAGRVAGPWGEFEHAGIA